MKEDLLLKGKKRGNASYRLCDCEKSDDDDCIFYLCDLFVDHDVFISNTTEKEDVDAALVALSKYLDCGYSFEIALDVLIENIMHRVKDTTLLVDFAMALKMLEDFIKLQESPQRRPQKQLTNKRVTRRINISILLIWYQRREFASLLIATLSRNGLNLCRGEALVDAVRNMGMMITGGAAMQFYEDVRKFDRILGLLAATTRRNETLNASSPIVRFLKCDGDNAIISRVNGFLYR